jgi:ADP-ribose pyrophosphatase YjhB (NUDIX family)
MNFCANCGQRVTLTIPDGDNRPRSVCPACQSIFYVNPKIVTGTVCTWGDRILLCRRAIEPRHGYWTLPAGFMEVGETAEEGAIRETLEEAGARVTIDGLYTMLDVVHVEQVHLFYRGRMTGPELDPGTESLEARLFLEEEIPWKDLAFRTVAKTLTGFVEDRRAGSFALHTGRIDPPAKPVSA